ncbi:MAG: hypothetical protein HYU66_16460 [Armatimonadetes bacterium]|nr:hypothetical protein [Armatimonadota bacterium]
MTRTLGRVIGLMGWIALLPVSATLMWLLPLLSKVTGGHRRDPWWPFTRWLRVIALPVRFGDWWEERFVRVTPPAEAAAPPPARPARS